MKTYIGTKVVQAEPALRITDPWGEKSIVPVNSEPVIHPVDKVEEGYRVVYKDGYESWSPKAVFEEAYRECQLMVPGIPKARRKVQMKTYIGTKIVQAEPALRITDPWGEKSIVPVNSEPVIHPVDKVEEGYRVVYKDGYESWSPKAVFEEAYRDVGGMSFGLAIEAAKMGMKIARKGWNGKNQYVELASGISYKNGAGEVVNVEHCNIGNKALAFVGTSGVQMGWLASQADMLADDWQIVERAWNVWTPEQYPAGWEVYDDSL